jgi:4-amino-4-deoxy-L-arabinose transferase-like glycosyltransferase
MYFSRKIIYLCLFAILIQILQVLYFQRGIFKSKYDTEYWKDRYEHSQYQLPLSKRIIGDDGLYAYAGYRLIKGDDPFSINVDKPPFGKYLIGLSILIFNNRFAYSFLFGIGSILIFFTLSKKILQNPQDALVATAFLSCDLMFISQLWTTTLDISQLFFLLLSLLCIFEWFLNDYLANFIFIFLSGLSLGLFSEIKPPITLPIIIFLIIFLLFKKQKFWMLNLGLISTGYILGIILPYIQYLRLGHSLLDIIRVHKFMYVFYTGSTLRVHFGAILQSLFYGIFPNINFGEITWINEWSPVWPVITIVSFLGIIKLVYHPPKLKTINENIRNSNNLLLAGNYLILFFSLLTFIFIPAYPRYLLLILPFLYISFTKYISLHTTKKLNLFTILFILMFGVIRTFIYLHPTPSDFLSNFYYTYSRQYFQDLFEESLTHNSKQEYSREYFRNISQTALENAEIYKIDINETDNNISRYDNSGVVTLDITYHTQNLGNLYVKKYIHLIKEDNQWKINWKWDYLLSGFKPDYSVKTNLLTPPQISTSYLPYLISVNPAVIDTSKENEMIKYLEKISLISAIKMQNEYLENKIPNTYTPLFIIFKIPYLGAQDKLASIKGLTLYVGSLDKLSSYKGIKLTSISPIISSGKIEIYDNNNLLVKTLIEKNYLNEQIIKYTFVK